MPKQDIKKMTPQASKLAQSATDLMEQAVKFIKIMKPKSNENSSSSGSSVTVRQGGGCIPTSGTVR